MNEELDQDNAQVERKAVVKRPQYEAPRELGEKQGNAEEDHKAGREHRITRDDQGLIAEK